MKVKLHSPKRNLWSLALLSFILGLLGYFVPIPLLSTAAFFLIAFSAALLLLGTWIF